MRTMATSSFMNGNMNLHRVEPLARLIFQVHAGTVTSNIFKGVIKKRICLRAYLARKKLSIFGNDVDVQRYEEGPVQYQKLT